jgi:hypothetical protein
MRTFSDGDPRISLGYEYSLLIWLEIPPGLGSGAWSPFCRPRPAPAFNEGRVNALVINCFRFLPTLSRNRHPPDPWAIGIYS